MGPDGEAQFWSGLYLTGCLLFCRGGFVWLFYGSKNLPKEERPPIPFTWELEDSKWRAGEAC